MKHGQILIVAFISATLFAACSSSREVAVAPYRVPVNTWEGPWMAYKLTEPSGEELVWIWGIKGFSDYQWGTGYNLKIEERDIDNPPVDTPGREFILVEVLETRNSSEKDLFTLPVKENFDCFLLYDPDTGNLNLLNEIQVTLDSGIDQDEVLEKLLFCQNVDGEFFYNDGDLRMTGIKGEYDPDTALTAFSFLSIESTLIEDLSRGEIRPLEFIQSQNRRELWKLIRHPAFQE